MHRLCPVSFFFVMRIPLCRLHLPANPSVWRRASQCLFNAYSLCTATDQAYRLSLWVDAALAMNLLAFMW
jgi:hypothetical protein